MGLTNLRPRLRKGIIESLMKGVYVCAVCLTSGLGTGRVRGIGLGYWGFRVGLGA